MVNRFVQSDRFVCKNERLHWKKNKDTQLQDWRQNFATQYPLNKKVFLRERKRHTDRSVSSTPSVTRDGVLPLPRQGIPPAGVPPWQGYPPARSDGGGWVPPGQAQRGVPEVGYPRQGYPPPPAGPSWGTPLPGPGQSIPPRCGQTDTCQNITFPSYYVRGR